MNNTAEKTIENIERLTRHIMKTEFMPERQSRAIADKAVSSLGYTLALSEYDGKFVDSWGAIL